MRLMCSLEGQGRGVGGGWGGGGGGRGVDGSNYTQNGIP